jgi:hypothetical protein
MKSLLQLFIPAFVVLSSCAPITDRAIGISKAEMAALKVNHYWKEDYKPPTFGPGELEALMDRSTDPTLDGEYGEVQSSDVAVALATVGDERFAKALTTRSREVQVAVIRSVSYMWIDYRLHYPQTQAIASEIEGEQAVARQPA